VFTPRTQTQLRGGKLLADFLQVLESFVEMKVFKLLLSFNSARAVPRHDGSWAHRLGSQLRCLIMHLTLRGSV